jgi:opacity protein-like surface antigen
MKLITYSIAFASTVVLSSPAWAGSADWTQNLYVRADAGAIFQQDADLAQSHVPTFTAGFNPGVRVDLAVGYNLTQSLALELEPGFMWNSLDTLNGRSLYPGEGVDLYSVPILAGVIYKFPTHSNWTPFIGLAVGGNIGILDGTFPRFSVNDTDVTFAYQAQAGISYALSDNASLGVAYKFIGTTDQSYSLAAPDGYVNNVTIGGVYIHGIFVNFNWSF